LGLRIVGMGGGFVQDLILCIWREGTQ
jgi:hypothetical protein